MKSNTRIDQKEVGILGENIARKFLASRGYIIIDSNFTTPFGEIDIIAEKDDYTVFFEVKTRISEQYGAPLDSINDTKKKHIINNSEYYRKSGKQNISPCRIDAISIKLNIKGEFEILKHIKNAIETDY